MSADEQKLIDKFFVMIRKLNGTSNDILEIRKFFELVSEMKGFVPPTVEFMTILRVVKPKLFYEFKRSLVPNSRMSMLAGIDFNVGQAIMNLGITTEEQLHKAIKGVSSE